MPFDLSSIHSCLIHQRTLNDDNQMIGIDN